MEPNVVECFTDVDVNMFEYKWIIRKFGMCLDIAKFFSSSHVIATSYPFSIENNDIEWYYEMIHIPKDQVAMNLKQTDYCLLRLSRVCRDHTIEHLEKNVVSYCGFFNNGNLFFPKLAFHRFENSNRSSCTKMIPLEKLLRSLNIRTLHDSVMILCKMHIPGEPVTYLVNRDEE